MRTIGDALRDADPLRDDPVLLPQDVQAIRRTILETARRDGHATAFWLQPLAVAAAVVTMIGVGLIAGHRLPAVSPVPGLHSQRTGIDRAGEPRQLQFATPGGTRIIWVLDPEFSLKETMP